MWFTDKLFATQYLSAVPFVIGPTVGVGDTPTPTIGLMAVPNPTRSTTRLRFTLPDATTRGVLSVFNAAGRRVDTRALGPLNAGAQSISWPDRGQSLPAGVYFAHLEIDGQRWMQKITLLN